MQILAKNRIFHQRKFQEGSKILASMPMEGASTFMSKKRIKKKRPGASEEFVVEMEELIRNLESAEGDFECPADDSSYDRIPDPEPDIPSEQIPGKKSNTWTYADGRGFYFKLEKRNKDKAYMACIDKTCRMRGVMLLGKEGAPIRITTPTLKHTHPENFELGEKLKIIHHFKKRSIEESHLNITKILEEESVGVDLGMKNKIKRAMSEARKSKGLPFAGNSAVEEQEEEENGRPSMKFPGPKASWIYTDGTGYFYQAKRINRNGKRILNCINQDCPSTARMALDEDAPICAATEHSHPPSSMTFTPEELEVQRKLTSAFGSETVGFAKAKQSHVDAKSLKRAMARARRSATNRNSQNVFADNLEAAVGHILQ